jgi:hypothetical protein
VTTAPLSNFGFAVAVHPHDAGTAWFVPGVKDERGIPVDAALVVNRTRDGGRGFESLRAGLLKAHCNDLIYCHGLAVADDGRVLLMGSTTGHLWSSFDGGEYWQELPTHLPPICAVCMAWAFGWRRLRPHERGGFHLNRGVQRARVR